MKLTKNFVKGLTATAALAGVATPLTMITSCSCSKNKDFVVDVTNGYTPSEKWKTKKTDEASLSTLFEDWFRFVEINPGLPNEEFKWTMGEKAKRINEINVDSDVISITGKANKVTAGIKDFVINDHVQKTVSFEMKGSLDFSIFGDASQSAGTFANKYQIDTVYSYDVKVHNLPLTQDDGSAFAFNLLNLLGNLPYGEAIPAFWKNVGPMMANLSEQTLSICPNFSKLLDSNDWYAEIDTRGEATIIENDEMIDTIHFGDTLSLDYETVWVALQFLPGEIEFIQMFASLQSLLGWGSFYSKERPIIKFADRVKVLEDEDITQPLVPIKDTDNNLIWRINLHVNGTAEEWENNVGFLTFFSQINSKNINYQLYANVAAPIPEKPNEQIIEYTLKSTNLPEDAEYIESVYLPIISANEGWFHAVEIPVTTVIEE